MNKNSFEINRCLNKLRQGDNSALDCLYEITKKQLYSLCYCYFGNREDSEDALFDCYIKIVENIDKFDGKNGFNWMFTIAKNISINKLKKERRNISLDLTEQSNINKFNKYSCCENVVEDESGVVQLAKELLDEIEFEIIVLHALNGYKFKEIAKIIDKKESTTRWSYNNAIGKIRKEYERRYCSEK